MRDFYRKRSLVFLILILIILIWQFWPDSDAHGNQQSNAQVNASEEFAAHQQKTNTLGGSTKDWLNKYQFAAQRKDDKATESERSLLQIYREMRTAEECFQYYKLAWDKRIPLTPEALIQARLSNAYADTRQIEALSRFLDTCDVLKKSVYQRENLAGEDITANDHHRFVLALKEELNQANPETDEEQQLMTVLDMYPEFYRLYNEAGRIKSGLPQMHAEVQDELYAELVSIGQELADLRKQDGQEAAIELLEQRRDEVLAILMEEQPIDLEQPGNADDEAAIVAAFVEYTETVKSYLNTQYPEAFEAAYRVLHYASDTRVLIHDLSKMDTYEWDKAFISEYISPAQQLQQTSKFNHNKVFYLSLSAAINLYMCYLGDDCGIDTKYTRRYCLGAQFDTVMYPEACDMDLVSFYTDVLFTQNQQKDVFRLLDLMIDSYAF